MSTDGNIPATPPTPPPPPKPKLSELITQHGLQEELNTMMAQNRKKLTEQNQDLVTQLEQLKQSSNLSQTEKDELQVRITQLEQQYLTKEELAKREAQKNQKDFEMQLTTAKQQGEQWKGLYTSSTIERALQDAAVAGKSLQHDQIVDMYRSRTEMVEVLENGRPTGRYTPIVKFNDINEEGKPVVLELSPADLIKRMKELPEKFGNLFEGTATGGTGGTRGADGSAPSVKLADLMKDPVKYAKWRKENPDLDLSKLK